MWGELGLCYSLLDLLPVKSTCHELQGYLAEEVHAPPPPTSAEPVLFTKCSKLPITAGFSFIRHSLSLPFIIYLLLLSYF